MPAKRKELNNYKEKIQEYLRANKDNLKKCTKQELNYILNVDNIYMIAEEGQQNDKKIFLKNMIKHILK